MATIDDVAQAAGVSISTVSYALSGKRKIKPETRTRVLAAAQELGYMPHASARMLAANHSNIIAVTAPLHVDTDEAAHMTFALEVTRAARAHDYDSLLLVDDEAVNGMQRTAATSLADGVVVLDVDIHDERAPLARHLDFPTVFIGIPEDTTGLMCVDLDFEAAARQCVDRLYDAGHRQVGLISHERTTIERESNFPLRFRDAFTARAQELSLDHAIAYPVHGRAGDAVDDLLAELPELTGIVLNTGQSVAESLVPSLARRGRAVPDDVSVIAGGATFRTDRFRQPIDTIPLDARASCSAAVDLLVDAIEAGHITPQVVLLEPTYIDHGSVRPPGAQPPQTQAT